MNETVARRSGKPARATAGEGEWSLRSALTGTDHPSEHAPAATLSMTVVGARGGQGASTIAAALALFAADHTRTRLHSHDLAAAAALLGLPEPRADSVAVTANLTLHHDGPNAPRSVGVVVHDAGRLDAPSSGTGGTRLVVLRGPCYLGLRTLVAQQDVAFDGIVLVAEPGRSLERRDVEDVTGVPVVATVPVSARVARAIDAGLLVARLPQLREFASLRRYTWDTIAATQRARWRPCDRSCDPLPRPRTGVTNRLQTCRFR